MIELEKWFKDAIKQNKGMFIVHKKEVIYSARSLNLFSYKN